MCTVNSTSATSILVRKACTAVVRYLRPDSYRSVDLLPVHVRGKGAVIVVCRFPIIISVIVCRTAPLPTVDTFSNFRPVICHVHYNSMTSDLLQ